MRLCLTHSDTFNVTTDVTNFLLLQINARTCYISDPTQKLGRNSELYTATGLTRHCYCTVYEHRVTTSKKFDAKNPNPHRE